MVRIVEPSVEIFELNDVKDILKHIEKCGRNCYKSEKAITNESAETFIKGILKSGHESVIEHANLTFKARYYGYVEECKNILKMLNACKGLEVRFKDDFVYFTGNMRTFRDITRNSDITMFNDYFKTVDELKPFVIDVDERYQFLPFSIELVNVQSQNNELTDEECFITAKITTDVGSYKDLTRHRLASFSIESTRYCNYDKDKFGSEITVMKPSNIEEETVEYNIWLDGIEYIEKKYMEMAKIDGVKTDQLRMLLSHSTKADVVMTASVKEWKHIFNLRCAKQAHPSVRHCMCLTLYEFYKKYPNRFQDLFAKYLSDIIHFMKKSDENGKEAEL